MKKKQLLNFNVDIKAQEPEQRIIQFRGSTGDIDRANEVVEPKGWQLENYAKNPVFLWGHNYSQPPIGKAVRVKKSKDGLDFDIKFATQEEYPFADTIYRLYRGGFIKSVSVGFIPVEWKDGDAARKEPSRTIIKQELLELSAVSVPANPNALMNACKGGVITDAEMKDFEFEAAKEEQYAQENGLPIMSAVLPFEQASQDDTGDAIVPEPEGKDVCEIIDETGAAQEPESAPEQEIRLTNAPKHEIPIPTVPEDRPYDRSKAFNRLATWSGFEDDYDSLPNLNDKGISALRPELQENVLKLSTAFAYRDEQSLRYMHHDVQDGALVTNYKGVTQSMRRLLEDVYDRTVTLEQGREAHKHLAEHYADFKRIAPSFNLFRLEAVRELFSDDTSSLRSSSFVPDLDEVPENEDENAADVLVSIMNGLESEDGIDEEVVDLLDKVVKSNKEKKQ